MMAEVVGVVAGATQLATTCLTLVELARKIKGGSSSLQNYQKQLQETRDLSQAISQNPLLQTPEVEVHVYSLLTLINEHDLKPLIERGRFFRSLSFIVKDRELSEVFTSLERHKTNLSLMIHNLQAQAIHHIQADIQGMASSQCPDMPTRGEPSQSPQTPTTQRTPSKELVILRRPAADTDKDSPPQQPRKPGEPPMPNPSSTRNFNLEEFIIASEIRERAMRDNPNSNVYYNNTVHGGKMHNGNLYSNTENPGGTVPNNINLSTNTYLSNHAIGVSEVHNGHCYELCGDSETNVPRFSPDFFMNNTVVLQTTPVQGKMHNGIRIIMGKERRDEGMEDKGSEKKHN